MTLCICDAHACTVQQLQVQLRPCDLFDGSTAGPERSLKTELPTVVYGDIHIVMQCYLNGWKGNLCRSIKFLKMGL